MREGPRADWSLFRPPHHRRGAEGGLATPFAGAESLCVLSVWMRRLRCGAASRLIVGARTRGTIGRILSLGQFLRGRVKVTKLGDRAGLRSRGNWPLYVPS